MMNVSGFLGWAHLILILVALQRGYELVLSNRNTKKLLQRGATEVGSEHYALFILLHSLWLISMFVLVEPSQEISWLLLFIFLLLQLMRVWVINTLGAYWTTRIITIDEPLISSGPYKTLKHPNYVIVLLEIPILPLAMDLHLVAIVFALANIALISFRIRIEEQALGARRVLKASE